MEKLIIAQVDHASGELIGQAIQDLISAGAKNVQLLQTLTKKGRPGYLMMIDSSEEKVASIVTYLAQELNIWGYYILDSKHVHFDISFQEKPVLLLAGEHRYLYLLKPKYVKDGERILSIKVDHSQLLEIHKIFKGWGYQIPIHVLRVRLEALLYSDNNEELYLQMKANRDDVYVVKG